MGLCSRYKSLTCNSCSMHCQIMPEESPRLQYCANSCFCMWPEESSYFNRGVVEGILTKNHNARLSGYIFVDFSVSFLRLFLEKDWIDYLASTDMGIVLVSDRNMQSLANYWRKHNSAISAVIYNDDGLDVVCVRTFSALRNFLTESLVSFSSPNLQYHAYRPFHESAKTQCPLYTSHFYRDSMLLFNNHLPSILKLIPLMCR